MKRQRLLLYILLIAAFAFGCGKGEETSPVALGEMAFLPLVSGGGGNLRVVGLDSIAHDVYTFDPETDFRTVIGPLSRDPAVFANPTAGAAYCGLDTLAPFGPSGPFKVPPGAFFAWDNTHPDQTLLVIDGCTGLATPIGAPRAAQSTDLQGLAFTLDGRLFGVDDDLYEIDPTNGEVTLIGPLGFSAGAAEFDTCGTLYVVQRNGGGPEVLGTVNLETGATSPIGVLSTDIGMIGSITFDPSHEKLVGSGLGGPLGNILFDIDPTTAQVSNLRSVESAPLGMGFVPPCGQVLIDIKPGSDVNPINPMSRGVIPVAILGSQSFDVATVDCSSIVFGPNDAAPVHRVGCHGEDVNGDPYPDLIVHFRVQETGFRAGDTQGCLTAQTLDGIELEGCDAITIVPQRVDPPVVMGNE